MNISNTYHEQLSTISREGCLFVLVWIIKSRKTLLCDIAEELYMHYPNINEIILDLESKSLLTINIENGQQHVWVKNQNILDLLDLLTESLLKNYMVIK